MSTFLVALTRGSVACTAAGRHGLANLRKKRPLIPKVDGVMNTLPVSQNYGFHSSASVLGGGTPTKWNHVWNWKMKQRLAAMKEADEKPQQSEEKSHEKDNMFRPLPGERVIELDENLPDGVLEEYWAELRREREGSHEGTDGKQTSGRGQSKRKTIKKHFLYGWTYAPKRNKQITEEDTGANTSEIDGNAREFNNSQKPASTPAGRAALRNEG
ncbi:hypothetical protein Naga_100196g12 [Nannochloropsis gaditana]|uniref:Uncharacterized protein n=1 Tax=Nannochloropsis gaditana TaxID=72520 RepID=W7TY61_9STRA|nr:hypothetical protein Naga_100196g12 [Nannochloropsis gaditana]